MIKKGFKALPLIDEVIEGAMSTLYGAGAMGGVVNIITKKNKSPYWIDSNIQYDKPIGMSQSINAGVNKNFFNYSFNLQYATDYYSISTDYYIKNKTKLELDINIFLSYLDQK